MNVNMIHIAHVIHELQSAAPRGRQARRDQRTEQLLDEAMKIVEEGGFDALTLHRVAERLGYATTAIYRYFPSKDALSAALQRRAVVEIQEHFSKALAEAEARVADRAPATASLALLLVAADTYLALPRALPRAWHFVALLLGDPRPLLSNEEAAKTAVLLQAFMAEVGELFARAERTQALDTGPLAPRLLAYWAALHGAACLEKMRRLALSFPGADEVGRTAARAMLAGWGASPQRLSAAAELAATAAPTEAPRRSSSTPKK